MTFTIIAAMEQSRGVGKDNAMPWHLSADLKHFAKTTMGGAVIMGRKTWESIPDAYRPFKGRLNIVISRQEDYELPDGVKLVHSLDEALSATEDREAFVIGGANIFEQAIVHQGCNRLILTQIHADFEVDTYFPAIPEHFKIAATSEVQEEKGLRFQFLNFSSII
jgi:dihydrofolate reductase